MKKKFILSLSLTIVFAMCMLSACSFSTANLSSLKTATDREGKSATTKFKAGDTFFGIATISNNPGTVKVKLYLTDPKGSVMKQTELTADVEGDGNANLNFPVNEGMPPGDYKITAEMTHEGSDKKDTKTAAFTLGE